MEPQNADARRTAVHTSTFTARATLLVAAATLLITGCGSQRSTSQTASSSKPPKLLIATDAGAAPAAAAALAPGTSGGPGTGMGIRGASGGYVIAGTLPDQPTHAPIYLWPSTQPSQADVAKLAAVLGLTGTPQRHAHGWDLRTGSGELRVRDYPGHEWSYGRADMLACPSFQVDIDSAGNYPNGGYGCAVPLTGVQPNGPDEATTKAAATSLLTALGLTGDGQFSPGAPTSSLNVSPQVAGLPTQGIETNVEVDARGIAVATGYLQAPVAGDDYPLQTAKVAFDSIAARPQPMIAMYCGPIPGGPNRFGGVASEPPAVPTTAPTPAPVESSPVTCPKPEPIKVTGAHIGLQIEYNATSAGATILVPSWFFTLADGSVATTAVAVDPSYLGTPPQPTDVATNEGDGSGLSAEPPAVPPAASSMPASS